MDLAKVLGTAYLLIGVLTVLLGLVILRESAGARLNRLTSMMLVFAGIGAVLGSGSLLANREGAGWPPQPTIAGNFAYLWEFFFPTLLLFAATFPREISLLRRHSWGEFLVYVPHTIHFILMFSASIWGTSFGLEGLGVRLPLLGGLADLTRILLREFFAWHRYLFSLVNLSYVGASVFLIARNQRRATNPAVRTQLWVILIGMGVGVVLYSISVPLNVLLGLKMGQAVSTTMTVGALGICAGTIAYAIVRYRFLDARWIVRRTILYAAASAVLVGVYLQIVRQLNRSLAEPLHLPPGTLDWVALVVPLVLFQPIMTRLEEGLEGWILRGRRELRNVVGRFSQEMGSTLDFDSLAKGMVRELPDSIAASGAAVLLRSGDGEGGAYRTVAARGMDASTLTWLVGVSGQLPDLPSPGSPYTRREWVEAAVKSGDDRREAEVFVRSHAPQLAYELQHGGERLGLLLLGSKVSGMRYSGEEVSILTSLASQAGVALKNSMLYQETLEKAVIEEELALARKIQQTFLPSHFPCDLPVDVHGLNLPSKQVGGDYYDFFSVKGGGYALAIADVSGKGVPAALLASMLRASLRTLMGDGAPVGRVVERVNAMIVESTSVEQFVTLFLAHLDLTNGRLTYCNAGHNYPIHLPARGAPRFLTETELVLGIDGKMPYPEQRLDLEPGDTLLLYTDGVTEARDASGEEFGEERLGALLCGKERCSSKTIVGRVRDEVLAFTGAGEFQDDMTLLCLRLP
jgi:phosphoserine phosphatase RsbU/P